MAFLTRTLLVVCHEASLLRVFTCVAGLRGWSLGREETVALSSPDVSSGAQPEAIAAAVRPLMLRWGIPPGTEVALVMPPATGGILSIADRSGTRGTRVDPAWLESELAARIPFASKDVEYETCAYAGDAGRSIQVAWVPRTVAIEFRAAFARLGLTLGEIVFRAQLYAAQGRGATVRRRTELLIERWAGWSCFHLIAGDRILRTSMAPTPALSALADRLRLELLSTEDHEAPAAVVLAGANGNGDVETALGTASKGIGLERRAMRLSDLFLRFWRAGETGIWLVPENPPPLAMARRLAFAIAACGIVIAAALAWDAAATLDEATVTEAREARLRPQYRALRAKERQLTAATETLDAVARIETAPVEAPDVLMAVFNALPRSAWVTRFSYEGRSATVAGKGIDAQAAIEGLKKQPGVGGIDPEPTDGSTARKGDGADDFRAAFQWAPAQKNSSPPRPGAPKKKDPR